MTQKYFSNRRERPGHSIVLTGRVFYEGKEPLHRHDLQIGDVVLFEWLDDKGFENKRALRTCAGYSGRVNAKIWIGIKWMPLLLRNAVQWSHLHFSKAAEKADRGRRTRRAIQDYKGYEAFLVSWESRKYGLKYGYEIDTN